MTNGNLSGRRRAVQHYGACDRLALDAAGADSAEGINRSVGICVNYKRGRIRLPHAAVYAVLQRGSPEQRISVDDARRQGNFFPRPSTLHIAVDLNNGRIRTEVGICNCGTGRDAGIGNSPESIDTVFRHSITVCIAVGDVCVRIAVAADLQTFQAGAPDCNGHLNRIARQI